MGYSKFRPNSVSLAIRDLLRRQGLSEQIETLAGVSGIWDSVAGPEWRRGSWVESWDGMVLTIGVSDPGAATRLRFEARELLPKLQKEGLEGIQELRAAVRPTAKRGPVRRHRRYSPEAATRVACSATDVSDPELRGALLRLADRLQAPPRSGDDDKE